ncbi:tape measure protein [Hallerella succinigenes]|uniref:Tape measure domain-containing protein n=1 Tax=Hallerella succinigenes TaxID=1896222 RepID=A0A2M9A9K1_9BACT|nr:tape measure protein [Hallerella succinigenes]PJJ42389.1 tape measure domain-containing protein [Hallerella succinigenes]
MAEDYVFKIKAVPDLSGFDAALKSELKKLKLGFGVQAAFNGTGSMSKGGNTALSSMVHAERNATKSLLNFSSAVTQATRGISGLGTRVASVQKTAPKVAQTQVTAQKGANWAQALMALPGMQSVAGLVTAFPRKAFSSGLTNFKETETLRTNLGTLLGSDERGAAFTKRLEEYAKYTPYAMNDIASLAKGLIQYNVSEGDTEKLMKQVGDIAMGSKSQMSSLGLVLGQVASAGKLQGQDLLQFINAGFNPLAILSEAWGRPMAELKDAMSEGKISFEMVREALNLATQEGGKFYKGAERGSKTLEGLLSTAVDNFSIAMGDAFRNNEDVIKGIATTMASIDWTGVSKMLGDIVNVVGRFGGGLATLIKAIAPFPDLVYLTTGALGGLVAYVSGNVMRSVLGLTSAMKSMATQANATAAAVGTNGATGQVGKFTEALGGPMLKGGLYAATGWAVGQIVRFGSTLLDYLDEKKKAKETVNAIEEDGKIRSGIIKTYKKFNADGEWTESEKIAYRETLETAKRLGVDVAGSYLDIFKQEARQEGKKEGEGMKPPKLPKPVVNISADFNSVSRLVKENLTEILRSQLRVMNRYQAVNE